MTRAKLFIVCEMRSDPIEPYKYWGNKIPYVVASNHYRFQRGTRFDYGFLHVALKEGYNVALIQEGELSPWDESPAMLESKV
jgi:hypothetical protein